MGNNQQYYYKVLHIPTTVGGNPQGLSAALNKLGVYSESWTLSQNFFAYPATKVIWNEHDNRPTKEVKRIKAIFEAAIYFDIIHLNFGNCLASPFPLFNPVDRAYKRRLVRLFGGIYTNILALLEINLYSRMRRPIFIHYQGDDARQGDVSLKIFEHSIAQYVETGYYTPQSDAHKRFMIKIMSRYCRRVYAVNPDLLHVLGENARFIPYCHICLEDWKPVYISTDTTRPLRIGHAPSHRRVKGTDIILATLGELKQEGYRFDLVLVEGLSHAEARLRYEHCDVLIDQIHAGWYGGLAVELMALGKPVMVYIREKDLRFIPKEMREDFPFLRTSVSTLKQDLRNLLSMNREQLYQIGIQSRRYVEKWHDPLRIASEIKQDYELALLSKGR